MRSPHSSRFRSALTGAILFSLLGLLTLLESRHAQLKHTIMQYRGSWYTPAAGYVAAAGFFAVAAYGFVLAFRKSDEDKD
jgi:hypothetical protein